MALNETGCEEEEEDKKVLAEREERVMRFCPEVMDAALSAESRQATAQSLVRGASKVLAEHRGHQKNLERLKIAEQEQELDTQEPLGGRRTSDQSALQNAVAMNNRSKSRCLGGPWRRRGAAAPPLRSATPMVDECCSARASPDFRKIRQDLPRKEKIIAARRYRKKQEALRQVHGRVTDLGFGVAETLGRTPSPRPKEVDNRPVCCSPEVSAWRSPTPLEQRLMEECNVVAGSQWREYLEGIRFGRIGAQSAKRREPNRALGNASKEPSCERHADLERQRSRIDSGKVEDCPDAHAAHLLRQGNIQALERWGGLRYARPHVQSQGLFRAVRSGQHGLLSWLLEELQGIYLSNEAVQWREKAPPPPHPLPKRFEL
ncbi:HERC2 [Symbiodinium natans]|uniref:HERC2 protein n=1 Tax=Symbiodinium natans TaxID=878477 RepID=A0A812UEY6_9DINO|nr:HERC2 [Symbiodinium natans]